MFGEQTLNRYSRLPKCIKLASSSKDLKSLIFSKIHLGYMLIYSKIPLSLSPLGFPLNGAESTHVLHDTSLPPTDKLEGLWGPLVRRKRDKGRQRPLEPPIFVPGLSLSSLGLFIAWSHAHPSITAITAKAHSEWKTLDEAHPLLYKIGTVQGVYHFHDHRNPNNALLHFLHWIVPV